MKKFIYYYPKLLSNEKKSDLKTLGASIKTVKCLIPHCSYSDGKKESGFKFLSLNHKSEERMQLIICKTYIHLIFVYFFYTFFHLLYMTLAIELTMTSIGI